MAHPLLRAVFADLDPSLPARISRDEARLPHDPDYQGIYDDLLEQRIADIEDDDTRAINAVLDSSNDEAWNALFEVLSAAIHAKPLTEFQTHTWRARVGECVKEAAEQELAEELKAAEQAEGEQTVGGGW